MKAHVKGLCIIELMIIVAIIGILLAAIIPACSGKNSATRGPQPAAPSSDCK